MPGLELKRKKLKEENKRKERQQSDCYRRMR